MYLYVTNLMMLRFDDDRPSTSILQNVHYGTHYLVTFVLCIV